MKENNSTDLQSSLYVKCSLGILVIPFLRTRTHCEVSTNSFSGTLGPNLFKQQNQD